MADLSEPLSEQEWDKIRGFRQSALRPGYWEGLLLRALAEVQAERDQATTTLREIREQQKADFDRAEQAEAALAKMEKERDDYAQIAADHRTYLDEAEAALAKEKERADTAAAVLKDVCEDVFGEDCSATCDSYGHAGTCGATFASAHAANLKRDLATERATSERLREALRKAKRTHLVVDEDCWYSCPMSGRCCRDFEDEKRSCECGAEEHNAAIDAALAHD